MFFGWGVKPLTNYLSSPAGPCVKIKSTSDCCNATMKKMELDSPRNQAVLKREFVFLQTFRFFVAMYMLASGINTYSYNYLIFCLYVYSCIY